MQTQTVVYLSRFRDSLTPGVIPLVEEFDHQFRAELPPPVDLVSIHSHALERDRYLVVEWSWDGATETWRQTSVVNAPSIENARQYAPPRAKQIKVPAEFGLEAWVS